MLTVRARGGCWTDEGLPSSLRLRPRNLPLKGCRKSIGPNLANMSRSEEQVLSVSRLSVVFGAFNTQSQTDCLNCYRNSPRGQRRRKNPFGMVRGAFRKIKRLCEPEVFHRQKWLTWKVRSYSIIYIQPGLLTSIKRLLRLISLRTQIPKAT